MKKTFSFSTRNEVEFIIDGVKYKSIEEMPEPVRAKYAHVFRDDDGNGMPDIAETGGNKDTVVTTRNRYIINNTEYDSLESMPPGVREMYEKLIGDRDKNDIPVIQSIDTDVIEAGMREISGKSGSGNYNDIKIPGDDEFGIYRSRNYGFGGKWLIPIIVIAVFALFIAL